MKRKLLPHFLCFLALVLFGIKANATQLSGIYTIDSAGTPSATVFRDFNSAIIFLTSATARPDGGPANSSPFGVSGAVVFEVMQGTYTEQITVPAITGASAANTITFDGGPGGAATRIIQFTAPSTTDGHTLRYSACTYVTFQNLSIKSIGTAQGLAVHFFGACSFNTLKKCSVTVATSSSANFRAINCTGTTILTSGGGCSGPTTTSAINNIFIDSNYVSGGYYGIFLSSNGAGSGSFNFYIRGNQLLNAYLHAIGASGSYGYLIMNNLIKPTAQSGSYGLYHCNGSTGAQSYQIVNNVFENCGTAGINWLTPNPAATVRSKVAQNYFKPTFISASAQAINVTYGPYTDVWANTILMNSTGGTGIVTANAASQDIRNNIVILTAPTATGLCISQASTSTPLNYNNNVYIKNNPSSPDLIQVNGSNLQAANFKGVGGFNANSSTDNPVLTNPPGDIRPQNICQKGAAITINVPTYGNLTTDINGTTRLNPPQIGASEAGIGLALDAAAVGFTLPLVYPVSAGYQDVKVVIKNNGSSPLTALNVTASLGGTNFRTIGWTGNLASCAFDTILFTGGNQLQLSSGNNVLRAWVDGPNYQLDSNATNDTISQTLCTPLATGTYTIDTSGAGNFRSFTEVANIINCGGLSGTGPTIFDVVSCTYNEQFALNAINGASAANPVIFRSMANHPDSVTLAFNSGTTNNYTIKMTNASYVKFEAMTIRALNATSSNVITMTGAMSFDTITNCKIMGTASATTGTTAALIFANGVTGKRNVFTNNTFTGGSYGLYLYGSSATAFSDSNIVENNVFNSSYYMTVAVSFVNNIKINKNRITPAAYTSHYGIYMATCSNGNEVIGNIITGQPGGYGIYMTAINGTASRYGMIKNNAIAGGLTSTFYGFYIPSSTYNYFYNNSVSANSSAATNYACWTQFTSTTGTTNIFRNNSFASTGTTTGLTNAALYVYNLLYLNSDYNNLYCAGATLVNVASPATNYPNIFAWRAISAYEKNSISYRPGYISNTNPRPNPMDSCSWVLNGNGTIIAGNNTDFDGNPRSTSVYNGPVDIGAFEFTPVAAPPFATANLSQLAPDSNMIFMFAGDTVATLKWDVSYGVPSSVYVRRYNGVRPPMIDTTANNYMYQYLNVSGAFGFYLYNVNQYYRNEWLGRVPNETSLRVAKRDSLPIYSWVPFTSSSSSVDTVRNILKLNLENFIGYLYTGTDDLNPLPVEMSYFNGIKKGGDVLLNWATTQEINSASFIIERSFDMNKWNDIGKVKAAGNSKKVLTYNFTDPVNKPGTIYYRLRMVDLDGKFEYSRVVTITEDKVLSSQVEVFPNPFNKQLSISLNAAVDQNIAVEIMDINGRLISSQITNFVGGNGIVDLDKVGELNPGIYLIGMEYDGIRYTKKVVKQ